MKDSNTADSITDRLHDALHLPNTDLKVTVHFCQSTLCSDGKPPEMQHLQTINEQDDNQQQETLATQEDSVIQNHTSVTVTSVQVLTLEVTGPILN